MSILQKDQNRCNQFFFGFNNIHYVLTMLSQGKIPRDLYSFFGGFSPGKTPQISIYSFGGVCDIIDGP